MNRFWRDIGISITMGLIVPALLLALVTSFARSGRETPLPTVPLVEMIDSSEPTAPQEEIAVLSESGEVMQLPLNAYLTGVVLAEMPVSFEEEALKAQTVVARTYTMRAKNGSGKHENAAVCVNSSCCQGYLSDDAYLEKGGKETSIRRIYQLVTLTDGEVLTYDGKLIEATYFSCSGGITEDAVAVWGTDVPYLQSVASPGEEHAAHYTDNVIFSFDDFASKLGIELSGKPENWFGDTRYTEGGGVATMNIGGYTFKGTELRKLLGLRSTAFDLTVNDNTILITTRGFGHRVGMSQYGADAMASQGKSYQEILAYYYQGTELIHLTD